MKLSQGEFVDPIEKGDEINKPCNLGYRDKQVKGFHSPRLADHQRNDEKQPNDKTEGNSGNDCRIAPRNVHLQD